MKYNMVNIEGTQDVSLSISGINLKMAMDIISVLSGLKVVSDHPESPEDIIRVYMHRITEENYTFGVDNRFDKINCIKVVREITGFGPKESKDFVEYEFVNLSRAMIEKLKISGIYVNQM